MLRLGLVAIMGGAAGVLAFHIPGLEVELLGEHSRGLFVFYSAALPVALLFLCSWLEEGSAVSQLLANGAAIGAGAALAIRLAIELFSTTPVSQLLANGAAIGAGAALAIRLAIELFSTTPVRLTFPFFGTLFANVMKAVHRSRQAHGTHFRPTS